MNEEFVRRFVRDRPHLDHAWEMGRDCGLNGANPKNCNFSLFATSAMTQAWEEGKRMGEAERTTTPGCGWSTKTKKKEAKENT